MLQIKSWYRVQQINVDRVGAASFCDKQGVNDCGRPMAAPTIVDMQWF